MSSCFSSAKSSTSLLLASPPSLLNGWPRHAWSTRADFDRFPRVSSPTSMIYTKKCVMLSFSKYSFLFNHQSKTIDERFGLESRPFATFSAWLCADTSEVFVRSALPAGILAPWEIPYHAWFVGLVLICYDGWHIDSIMRCLNSKLSYEVTARWLLDWRTDSAGTWSTLVALKPRCSTAFKMDAPTASYPCYRMFQQVWSA